MPRPTKTAERRLTLELNGIPVPIRVITERGRRSVRASITQKALNIRLPEGLAAKERDQHIAKMLDWAKQTARRKPNSFDHFAVVPAAAAYEFSLRDRRYRIQIGTSDRAQHVLLPMGNDRLHVTLTSRDTRKQVTEVLPKLLAKYFAGVYRPEVAARVGELNDRLFGRQINDVVLSDTYSRWGSCSRDGHIRLATRLLLAPPAVMDAVIVHELAHLVVADHSPRFWAEVTRALPDYRRYDAWLKEYGHSLRFDPQPVG